MAAPTIVKQVLENGARNYVALFTAVWSTTDPILATNILDPTSGGDMGVIFNGQTLYPGTHLKIWQMKYDASPGLGIELLWEAGSPQTAYILNGDGSGGQDFKKQGGLFVPQSMGAPITGATGKIDLLTHTAPVAGNFFSLNIWCKKDIHQ